MGAHTFRQTSSGEVMDRLRQLVQSLRESSRQAEQQLGVSGAQLFVVERLAETPSASLNELASRTYTHQSSVSTVVERLVKRRLVSRQPSRDDRRRLELVLTARGRRLAAETTGAAQHRLISAVQRLPARSRRQLAKLLREVVLGMNAADQPPRMFFDDDRKKVMNRNV